MADKIVSIKITADGKAFVADMAGNATAVSKVRAELQETGAALDSFIAKLGKVKGPSPANDPTPVINKTKKGLQDLGNQADKTAQQMRQVAPQITDIVTQLVGGQSPLQVFVQQGGQLKDVFGGVGPAVKAVGGYIASMISPTAVAAGAVGALAIAWYQGRQESQELTKQLILSGDAAGVTASGYYSMAGGISAVVGTKGAALDALQAIAQGGYVAAESLQRFATVAIQLDRVGKPIEDTVKEFIALGEAPVQASAKLTQTYNYLTAATYAQIKALADHGRYTEAARVAQEAFASSLEQRLPKMQENIGSLERGWINVKDAIKGAWDAMLGLGRVSAPQQEVARLKALISRAEGPFDPTPGSGNAELRAQLPLLRQNLQLAEQRVAAEQATGKAQNDQNEKAQAAIRWAAQGDAVLRSSLKLQQEIDKAKADGAKLGLSQAEIDKRIVDIRKKIVDQEAQDEISVRQTAIQASGEVEAAQVKENIDRITQLYKLGAVSEAQYIDMVGALEVKLLQDDKTRLQERLAQAKLKANSEREVGELQIQIAQQNEKIAERKRKIDQDQIARYEQLQKAADMATVKELQQWDDEHARAVAEQGEAYKQLAWSVHNYVQSLQDEIDDTKFQTSVMGKSGVQLQKLIELRKIYVGLRQKEREIDDSKSSAEEKAFQKDLAQKAAAEAAANVDAKIWVDTWTKANNEIGDDLYLALTGRGKDAADRLKSFFDQMVLKPTVMPLIQGGVNALTSAVFGSAGGSGGLLSGIGGSAAGSAIGGSLGLGGIGAAISGGWSAGMAGVGAAGIGGAGAAGLGASGAAELASTGALIGSGGIGGGIAGAASAGLAAIPVAGWIALAGIAAYSIFGGKGGGPKVESGFGPNVDHRGDPGDAKQIVDTISGAYTAAANSLGIVNNKLSDISVFIAKDPQGTAKTQLQVTGGNYDRGSLYGGNIENVGRTDADLTAAVSLAVTQLVVKNLQAAAQGPIGDFLKSIDVSSASLEELQKALQIATDVGTLGQALKALPIDNIANLSVAAQGKLIEFSGGLQSLAQNLAAYSQAFYSSDEQRTAVLNGIQSQLQTVGLSLAGIDTNSANARAEFRQLVDSIDATTEAGQRQRAMLYSLAPAFASVTQELKSAQQLIQEMTSASQDVASATKAVVDFGTQLQQTFDGIVDQINAVRGQALAAVKTAQGNLDSALANVAAAIQQAAQNVAAAKDQVRAAQDQVTQGYLSALEREDQVKQQITQAYLQAQDAVIAAQQAVTDAQNEAARAMRNAGDSIMDMLRQLAGTDAGSGNIIEQYTNLKNQLQYLGARAKAGDVDSANQIGAIAQQFLAISRQRNTAEGFTADDVAVRQLLAQIVAVTGTNAGQPSDSQSAIAAAQQKLKEAIDKSNQLQQLAISSGASLTASNEDLAAQLAAAVTEVAKWSAAVSATGAGRTQPDEVTQAVKEYQDAVKTLSDAQKSQAALLAATQSFDFSSLTTYTYDWGSAVQSVIDYQAGLAQAKVDAAAVDAQLYDAGGGLVGQYTDLQTKLADVNTQLADFATQVAGLDLQSGVVDPLQQLIGALRGALNQQDSASQAILGTAAGQTIASTYQQLLGRAPDSNGLGYWFNFMSQGHTTQDLISGITNSAEYRAKYAGTGDTSSLSGLLSSFDGSDGAWRNLYDAAVAAHVSSAQVEQALQLPQGAAVNWAIAHNLPAFETGTMYVQNDGPAILHRGEAVVPRRFNPVAFGQLMGGNDPALRGEVRSGFQNMRAGMEAIALHTSRMKTLFERVLSAKGTSLNVSQLPEEVFETEAAA